MKSTDVEIYLKDTPLSSVTKWLIDRLGECTPWQQRGKVYKCQTLNDQIVIHWYEKAVCNWHCLYLNSIHTPWIDDLSCALDANEYLKIEIRCASCAWSEAEEKANDREQDWLKIVDQKVSEIIWKT